MKTFRHLKFMAADEGGAGGGAAAVAEPKGGDGGDGGSGKESGYGKTFFKEMAKTNPEYAAASEKAAKEEGKADEDVGEVDKGKKDEAPPKEKAVKKPRGTALDAAAETIGEAPTKDDATDDLTTPPEDLLKDLPETLPEKGKGDHWKKARGSLEKQAERINAQAAEIIRQRKEIATAKEAPPDVVKELAETKAELDRYRDAMVEVNVELDPKYRDKYVKGRATMVDKTAAKFKAFGGNEETLKDALSMREGKQRNGAIKEILAEVEDFERGKILSLINDIDKLDDESDEQRANSQVAWEKLKKERAADAEKKKAETDSFKRTVFDKVADLLGKEVLPLRTVPDDAEGAAEWNATRAKIIEDGFKLAEPGVAPEEYAAAALWRYAGPILQTILVSTRNDLKAAMSRLKSYDDSEPGFRGGGERKATEGEVKTAAERYHEAKAKLDAHED